MGLFRCFQRKKTKTRKIKERASGKASGKESSGQRTPRSLSPSDASMGDSAQLCKPLSPKGDTRMLSKKKNRQPLKGPNRQPLKEPQSDLSRISEEHSRSLESGYNQYATAPPTAREAAFTGPPRFDWIDIETAAAIKIQAIYRRNHVMNTLEARGVTTSAIRNRRRRRKAEKKAEAKKTEASSSMFACCAAGFVFTDALEDEDKAFRDFQKKQYETRVKQQKMHEAALRKQYLKEHGAGVGTVLETVEVVE